MIKVNCKNCNIELERNPSAIRGNTFCSHSCSAKFNNYLMNKRVIKLCESCKQEIPRRRKYCSLRCNPKKLSYFDTSLEELKKKHPSLLRYHSLIRDMSRRIYFSSTSNRSCEKCGYTKHIQVCHIKNVSTFPKEAKLSFINDFSNLIGLCPNCHWEFDNIPEHGIAPRLSR